MAVSPKLFLEALIKDQVIDSATAEAYEIDSLKKNLPIDTYLLQETTIRKDVILKTKATLLNVGYIDIASTAIDPHALTFIPDQLARRYNILAYLYDPKNDVLYIATEDPLNINILEFFETKTHKKIILSLAHGQDITKAINTAYTKSISPEVKEALRDVATIQNKQPLGQAQTTQIDDAPIAKTVNTIVEFAVKSRTSDIHIEPQEAKTRVRYRIDGLLLEKLTLPRGIHESLSSRIKILSEMKIDEKRIPQDGRFSYKTLNEDVDLRVSTLPTVFGEKIVMRLLKKTGGIPTLNTLGFRGIQLKDFEEAILRPYGIILVTGPTGSGKTTTLYSVLNRLNTPTVNIETLEDPVEYQIQGLNQVQINPAAGLTFASGLRSFLRQDPNIVLVGEIRDQETAQLAIQAALTGHLVFSTLHTNDAPTTIPRLIDLGGEPFLIASVLAAIIAQRIVRRVCTSCKQTYEPPQEIQTEIRDVLGSFIPLSYKTDKPIVLAKGAGCDECSGSGYVGRVGIYEVLKITSTINKMILQSQTAKDILEQAKQEGFMTMKQDGYLKALDHMTTLEEVLRVAE